MRKLLIATHNVAKLNEIRKFLRPLLPTIKLLSLTDLSIAVEPEETGKTFEENAKLKAQYYAGLSKLPTISDDGGIVIDALNGEPGIHSNRWMGHRGSDSKLIDYCLKRMKDVSKDNRSARFETCLFFYDPATDRQLSVIGRVEGSISQKASPKVIPGYPYRSVFVVAKFGKLYTELSSEEHEKINHRVDALKRLAQKLKTWYN